MIFLLRRALFVKVLKNVPFWSRLSGRVERLNPLTDNTFLLYKTEHTKLFGVVRFAVKNRNRKRCVFGTLCQTLLQKNMVGHFATMPRFKSEGMFRYGKANFSNIFINTIFLPIQFSFFFSSNDHI